MKLPKALCDEYVCVVSVPTFLAPILRLLHQGYAGLSSSVAVTAGCMDAAIQMVVSTK
jgi:hypothetical protein